MGVGIALDCRCALHAVGASAGCDRAFIGGADIHEMATLDETTAVPFITSLKGLCDALRQLPVPVIARMAGWTLGGGLEVALACDLRLASDEARLGMPEVHVGIPSVIHAALLPRLIGPSAATWMLLTGEPVDAATALSWGLVHRCVPLAGLDAAIEHCAQSLAGLGPQVIRQQKALLRMWEHLPLDAAIAASLPEFAHAFTTGEPQHYMGRFIQRKH